jgi:hypothetical protein
VFLFQDDETVYETPFNDKNPRRTMKVGGAGQLVCNLLNAVAYVQQMLWDIHLTFLSVDRTPGAQLWCCATVATNRFSSAGPVRQQDASACFISSDPAHQTLFAFLHAHMMDCGLFACLPADQVQVQALWRHNHQAHQPSRMGHRHSICQVRVLPGGARHRKASQTIKDQFQHGLQAAAASTHLSCHAAWQFALRFQLMLDACPCSLRGV